MRPAVVLSTAMYQRHRPDVILCLITTKPADPLCPTDCEIRHWRAAGLHVPSCFRLYLVTLLQRQVRVVGRLADDDWHEIRERVHIGLIGPEPVASGSSDFANRPSNAVVKGMEGYDEQGINDCVWVSGAGRHFEIRDEEYHLDRVVFRCSMR